METEKILEGNKLIAEFMGEKIDLDKFGENWKKIITQHSEVSEIPSYDLSWDWLKPVVDKISVGISTREFDIDYELFYEGSDCKILHLHIYASIETTYCEVVKFIQWYNEQKK